MAPMVGPTSPRVKQGSQPIRYLTATLVALTVPPQTDSLRLRVLVSLAIPGVVSEEAVAVERPRLPAV
jgi:hypothetical protein